LDGTVIILLSLCLAFAAFVTMAAIFRDVLPALSIDEQTYVRDWQNVWGTLRFDRTIRKAWDEHARLFPQSRKRILLILLLLASALSVITYPLWINLASH
jgi:hypothetical protein